MLNVHAKTSLKQTFMEKLIQNFKRYIWPDLKAETKNVGGKFWMTKSWRNFFGGLNQKVVIFIEKRTYLTQNINISYF